MLPFLKAKGVKKIDYWIVSHTDADHISGLKEILQAEYEIDHIVFSKYVLNDEAYQELLALAQTYGTEILKMDCGDTLTDGEAGLRCIFPDKTYKSDDKNALSLVLRYERSGVFRYFYRGHQQRRRTVSLWNTKRLAASHLQGAHHGSRYSNSAEFPKGELSPEMHNHFLWGKQPLWASR